MIQCDWYFALSWNCAAQIEYEILDNLGWSNFDRSKITCEDKKSWPYLHFFLFKHVIYNLLHTAVYQRLVTQRRNIMQIHKLSVCMMMSYKSCNKMHNLLSWGEFLHNFIMYKLCSTSLMQLSCCMRELGVLDNGF